WAFSDVNPPVHAWSAWRVYKLTGPRGGRDRLFLSRLFQKLCLNFTWWVNRKDSEGNHLFGGGFLGLDNVGVFDRSRPLPGGGTLEQADGTAWMGFYCVTLLEMALELALAGAPRAPVRAQDGRAGVRGALHARRVGQRSVRGQLQLARPGVVPFELPARRGARALPPLLRQRPARRVPHRLGTAHEPAR